MATAPSVRPPKQIRVASAGNSNYRGALIRVTVLFFIWGFVTFLNDILVPHLKSIFDLNYARVMLIQFAFFRRILFFPFPRPR